MSDKLDQIFQLQKELDSRIEQDNVMAVANKLGYDIDSRINAKAQAIIHEAVEVQRLTSWKWWKKTNPPLDRKEALGEFIDIEHFLVSGVLDLGFSPDDFHQAYIGKNKENHSRQDRKY